MRFYSAFIVLQKMYVSWTFYLPKNAKKKIHIKQKKTVFNTDNNKEYC